MSLTLNKISESIAYKKGDQFNQTLREAIKHTLIYYRAKYARDDMSRNFLSYTDYLQTATIALEEADILEEFGASFCNIDQSCLNKADRTKYKVLKTKFKIPKPIRIKRWGKTYYKYLGSVDHRKSFIFTTFEEYEFRKTLPYQGGKYIYYTIVNNYGYILNNLELCDLLVEAIFADPRDVAEACSNKFKDDADFPMPADMLVSIENNIVTGEFPLITDGEEVNIQKDDTD